jgi:ABC-type uncharacterized transport system permease subunit
MAVALVIFARWKPLQCVVAALLFDAAGAIGPALQSVGITQPFQRRPLHPHAVNHDCVGAIEARAMFPAN